MGSSIESEIIGYLNFLILPTRDIEYKISCASLNQFKNEEITKSGEGGSSVEQNKEKEDGKCLLFFFLVHFDIYMYCIKIHCCPPSLAQLHKNDSNNYKNTLKYC